MKNSVVNKAYEYAIDGNISDITFVKISQDLNVSRRSLYRVFTNKTELLFEVYKRIVNELLEMAHCLNGINNSNKCDLIEESLLHSCLANQDLSSGYDLVGNGVRNMINVFISNPSMLKYITMYDAIPNKSEKLLRLQNEFYRKCNFTYNFILEGKKDGSITCDVDAYKLSCIILETVIGFMARYIDLSNESFSSYLKSEDLCLFINMIMMSLK